MTTARLVRATLESDRRPETDRRIDNVGRLTPGAGIETGSDQTAAEALQEAETEVGTAEKAASRHRCSGPSRSPDPVIDLGITA